MQRGQANDRTPDEAGLRDRRWQSSSRLVGLLDSRWTLPILDGIPFKVLTDTLRRTERDGLITRRLDGERHRDHHPLRTHRPRPLTRCPDGDRIVPEGRALRDAPCPTGTFQRISVHSSIAACTLPPFRSSEPSGHDAWERARTVVAQVLPISIVTHTSSAPSSAITSPTTCACFIEGDEPHMPLGKVSGGSPSSHREVRSTGSSARV